MVFTFAFSSTISFDKRSPRVMFAPQRCCPHCQGLKPCDTKQQRGSLRCNSHDLHMQKQNQHRKNQQNTTKQVAEFSNEDIDNNDVDDAIFVHVRSV